MSVLKPNNKLHALWLCPLLSIAAGCSSSQNVLTQGTTTGNPAVTYSRAAVQVVSGITQTRPKLMLSACITQYQLMALNNNNEVSINPPQNLSSPFVYGNNTQYFNRNFSNWSLGAGTQNIPTAEVLTGQCYAGIVLKPGHPDSSLSPIPYGQASTTCPGFEIWAGEVFAIFDSNGNSLASSPAPADLTFHGAIYVPPHKNKASMTAGISSFLDALNLPFDWDSFYSILNTVYGSVQMLGNESDDLAYASCNDRVQHATFPSSVATK